jgi:hypothetical protein
VRDSLATTGLVLAALALALQPDRAMAGALAAGLVALALVRIDRAVVIALTAAVAGLVATLIRPDTQPARPFVDQILYTAFDVHLLAGLAVVGGSLLLVAPAILARTRSRADVPTYAVFGSVWLAVVLAAALGNYPTPLVGYGGSAILGYLVSVGALPRAAP